MHEQFATNRPLQFEILNVADTNKIDFQDHLSKEMLLSLEQTWLVYSSQSRYSSGLHSGHIRAPI
jgi:hypothetical protein